MSNYAAKSNSKHETGLDTSQFAKTDDLANLKSDDNRLDIDKSKTTSADLCKLSQVVNNDVDKKDL